VHDASDYDSLQPDDTIPIANVEHAPDGEPTTRAWTSRINDRGPGHNEAHASGPPHQHEFGTESGAHCPASIAAGTAATHVEAKFIVPNITRTKMPIDIV